jgi:hypothetical protein
MFQDSLSVNIRELLRIGDGLQDLRQVIRCLNSIHGRRLDSACRCVMQAKGLQNRHDMPASYEHTLSEMLSQLPADWLGDVILGK